MIRLEAFIEFWGMLVTQHKPICVRHVNLVGWCFELHYPDSVGG